MGPNEYFALLEQTFLFQCQSQLCQDLHGFPFPASHSVDLQVMNFLYIITKKELQNAKKVAAFSPQMGVPSMVLLVVV